LLGTEVLYGRLLGHIQNSAIFLPAVAMMEKCSYGKKKLEPVLNLAGTESKSIVCIRLPVGFALLNVGQEL
jgi:hypothetical protein